jgi:hypothetical protein
MMRRMSPLIFVALALFSALLPLGGTARSFAATPALEVKGTVTAVSADSLSITSHSGQAMTFRLTATTIYEKNNQPAEQADVQVGLDVKVKYHVEADGSLKAKKVKIAQPTTPIPTTPQRTNTPIPTGASLPPLAVYLPQRQVVSGAALTIGLKTLPRGQISIVLRVAATHVVLSGKGRHRTRARHTVVLYQLTRQGTANRHGLFTTSVQVTYQPSRPMQATLTVTLRTSSGTVARTLGVTIQPVHHRR